jgi:hypothetical protein
VPLIERDVPRVAAFGAVPVANGVRMLHQQRTEAPVLPARINADHRQVPMRIGRMVAAHLIEGVEEELPLRLGNRAFEQRSERIVIGMRSGRQPQRCAQMAFDTISSRVIERSAAEGVHK